MNSLISKTSISKTLKKVGYLNLKFAETLIAFPGEEVDWFYNYACLYSKRGEKKLALYYLEKALTEDPTLASHAREDRDLRLLWNDTEFITLLTSCDGKPFTFRRFSLTRILLFDIGLIFTIFSLLIYFFNKEIGRIIFEYGLVMGYVVEMIQAMIFRQRVFFSSLTSPLAYGTVLFSVVSLVIHKEGLLPLSVIAYSVVVIAEFTEMPFQWFVFGPKLKEYTAYRIQNISYGSLIIVTLIFAILRMGYLIQSVIVGNCSECTYYYSLQVSFFGGCFALTYFLFHNGITLKRAQIASILVTVAYLLMISATIQNIHTFRPQFLIWFVILYTETLLFVLITAIAEVYFEAQSANQQKITRYLVTVFWVFGALESVYATLLFAGLIPSSFPQLESPPLSIVVTINATMTLALWVLFLKLKGANIVNKYISIAGVSSSSINIESPFATALTNLETSGKKEAALTLMQLRDFISAAQFPEINQQKQALEILDTIAEETQKSQPKKLSIAAMISTLADIASLAVVINDKAPMLLDKLKDLLK